MKRRLLLILLLLVGGAIVNVAVAWGLYLWRPFEGHPFRPTTPSEAVRVWDRAWPPGTRFADDRDQRRYNPTGRFTATQAYRIVVVGDGPTQPGQAQWPDGSAWEFRAGWPARSIVGHLRQFDKSNHGLFVIKDSWVPIRENGSPIMDDYLPYGPSWPGLVINTLFYASLPWLIFVAPFALRRAVRRKYGHCAACGYNLHGSGKQSTVCPECGAALRR